METIYISQSLTTLFTVPYGCHLFSNVSQDVRDHKYCTDVLVCKMTFLHHPLWDAQVLENETGKNTHKYQDSNKLRICFSFLIIVHTSQKLSIYEIDNCFPRAIKRLERRTRELVHVILTPEPFDVPAIDFRIKQWKRSELQVSLWDVKYLLKLKLNKGKRLIDFVNDTHKSECLAGR